MLSPTGYGYIMQDTNEEDIYFNAKDLVNGRFDYLKVGCGVCYLEKETARGNNAKQVLITNRPNKSRRIMYL